MPLNEQSFSKGSFNYRKVDGGALESAPMFSYESGAKLYDVLKLNGLKYYRVNMGKWSNTIDQIKPVHSAIEAHFQI